MLNLGRSGAVYPVPNLAFKDGDKMAVDKSGELVELRTPEQGGGKNVPER